jgi:SAM-dependent methyltransferase
VFDFGSGVAHCALAFAAAGYRAVIADTIPDYLQFQAFMADARGLQVQQQQAATEFDFYDTKDGNDYGLVIEWSSFEHVAQPRAALERLLNGLVPGGMFVTTTFCKDWTPEDIEHYRRDSNDPQIAEGYLSGEIDEWLKESFTVLSPPKTLAKVLVKGAEAPGDRR